MKHIMISIRPEWTAKILNGEKTLEIRKTMPNCKEPCKVYIYCTRAKNESIKLVKKPDILNNEFIYSFHIGRYGERYDGKVVAEFTLKTVNKFDIQGLEFYGMKDIIKEQSCLDDIQLSDYLQNKVGYAWHIDDLKIYDKPKELSEFGVRKYLYAYTHDCWDVLPLRKPPQSWCYVEGERK